MRVAIVTESFLPRVNGVTNSVCRVLEHLALRGHEALVVAPGPVPPTYAGFPVLGMPSLPLPMYPSFVLGLPTIRVREVLRAYRPDVVHAAAPVVLAACGVAAARRLGIPSVAVFQTDLAGFAHRYGIRGADAVVWPWLRRVHAQADVNLVPSRAARQWLERAGIPRLAMWGRGVDADAFHPRHRSVGLRKQLSPDGRPLVGFVGRLSAEKRVHLLAGLDADPGLRLVVVGDGPAEARLRALLPNAAFLGFQSGGALSAAVASLDVFVHTGHDETFCQAVQEAQAAGVPVVAPAAGGPLDLVRHGHTGYLYPPDDVTALEAAVRRLLAAPAERAAMGVAARAAVGGRSWQVVCDELLAHYAMVSGRNRALGTAAAADPSPAGGPGSGQAA